MSYGSGLTKSVGGVVLELDSKWSEVSEVATLSLLPKLPHPVTTEFEKELKTFYSEQRGKISTNLQQILSLMKSVRKSQAAMRKHVIPLFLLLGEQEDGHQLWSSPSNEEKVTLIIAELYRIFDMNMVQAGPLSAFFLRDFESISNPIKTTFAHLLKTFRQSLGAKEAKWKYYPAAQHSFQWLLFQVRYPYVNDHLEACVLPSLNFLDDYEPENILIGTSCVSHILENALKSELKYSGWGLLMHDHLKKCLTFPKQTKIVDTVIPELLKVLKIIEIDPHLNSDEFTLYDSALESFLLVVETTDAVNKAVWLRHLTTYFDIIGHATLHWFDRIIRILMDNAVCVEPTRWLWVLKCTKVCILNTWMNPNADAFAEIILRIVININGLHMLISVEEKATIAEIEQLAADCLVALSHYDDFPNIRESLTDALTILHVGNKGKVLSTFLNSVKEVLTPTEKFEH